MSVLKIRTADLPFEPLSLEWNPPPPPEEVPIFDWNDNFGDRSIARFHHDAVEIRSVDDSFGELGPGLVLVSAAGAGGGGEEPSTFCPAGHDRRLVERQLPKHRSQPEWIFVNPDITLYSPTDCPSTSGWGCSHLARQHHSGIGMADTLVFDREGPLGRINQAQLLDHRL